MGLPAFKMNPESEVEQRITRLEAYVENIQSAVARIEAKMDRTNSDHDVAFKRLDAKIDEVDKRLSAKIEEVDRRVSDKIDDVKDSIASAKTWALGLYIALVAGLAVGFMWIVERLPPAH